MKKYTLVEQTKQSILSAIGEGRYLPGNKMMSVRKLCEEMNISHVTAAAAIRELVNEGILIARNGSGTYLSEKLPVRLQHNRTSRLQRPLYFFFRNINSANSCHGAILCTLQIEGEKRGWEVCANVLSKENFYTAAADPSAVGIVFAPTGKITYPEFRVPVINYDSGDLHPSLFPSVTPNHFSGGVKAAELLLTKNVISPYFITTAPNVEAYHFRLIYEGFKYTYIKHGYSAPKVYHWAINHPCRKDVEKLLTRKHKSRPVLVVGNRSMATELYIYLILKGLRIPEDVGMLTFVRRSSEEQKMPIDTFDFDHRQMAMEIIRLLERAHAGDTMPSSVSIPFHFFPEGSL